MKRWLPTPLISLTLLCLWLMLNQTLHPAHLLLGALVAVVVPLLVAPLRPTPVRVSRPMTVARLTVYSLIEILRSRSEEHTSELQSRENLVCRLLLEKKNKM